MTSVQADVLRFIHHSITTRGRVPSLLMIAKQLGFSESRAQVCVDVLVDREYLEKVDTGPARGLRLTDRAYAALEQPTPAQMREAIQRSERQRGLLIRCWSLLVQASPRAPLLDDLRAEIGEEARLP